MRRTIRLITTGVLAVGGVSTVEHLESSNHLSAHAAQRRCDTTLDANKVAESNVAQLPWVVATEKIGALSLRFLRDCSVDVSDKFGEVFETACVDKQTEIIQLDAAAEDRHKWHSLQQEFTIEAHHLERELRAAAYCAHEVISRLQ